MDTLFRVVWWIVGGLVSAGLLLVAAPLLIGVFNVRDWVKGYLSYIWPLASVMAVVAIVASSESAVIAGIAVAVLMVWAVKVLAPMLKPAVIQAFVIDSFAGVKVGPGGRRVLRAGERCEVFEVVGQYARIGPNEWVDKNGLTF